MNMVKFDLSVLFLIIMKMLPASYLGLQLTISVVLKKKKQVET